MSDTIQLLSPETMKSQYWEQYKMLATKLNETLGVLRAFNEKGVPGDVPTGPIVERATPAPSRAPAPLAASRETPVYQKTLSSLVREAARTIQTGITRDGITAYIRRVAPERAVKLDSLSALISQISKEEDWTLVEAGTGGKPNVYNLLH